MWAFLSRRYIRPIGQVGAVERTLGLVILLFTGGIVALFVVQATAERTPLTDGVGSAYAPADAAAGVPASTAPQSDTVFPDPGVPGWRAPERVVLYTRENLYAKINGRAPAYIDAGFVALRFGVYTSDADARRTIDVYWYDMARPENAETMFRTEAAPGAEAVAVGDEAYVTGGAVFFRQGGAYVQVVPTVFGDSDALTARSIAEEMSDFVRRRGSAGKEPAGGE